MSQGNEQSSYSKMQVIYACSRKNKKNEIKIKFEITFIEISNFTIRK